MRPLKSVNGSLNCSHRSSTLSEEFAQAEQILQSIPKVIQTWCVSQKNLVCCAQFGSSLNFLPKYFSDIDILVVYESLPKGRLAASELTSSLDDLLEPVFCQLRNLGFEYNLSTILRSRESLQSFSYFYLDLPEKNCLVYGDNLYWENFLTRIRNFRLKYAAVKENHGKQTVWNLSKTLALNERFNPEF